MNSLKLTVYVFKHWVSEGYLSKQQLKKIESRTETLEVPVEIGRLPKAITSNYGSYTAYITPCML